MSQIQLQQPIQHLPSFKEYEISNSGLTQLLLATYPHLKKRYIWDRNYWYVAHEDWSKVFADVLLNQPKYTADKFDCEQYAMLTSSRVGERYKLNTCGVAIGDSPYGEHGYCIFVSRDGDEAKLFLLEPQNGMVYSVDEPSGYKPRLVIFG